MHAHRSSHVAGEQQADDISTVFTISIRSAVGKYFCLISDSGHESTLSDHGKLPHSLLPPWLLDGSGGARSPARPAEGSPAVDVTDCRFQFGNLQEGK